MSQSRILNQGNNPYNAGAVILDSTPYTQYHLQQQAKEQAKSEALDKYFMDYDKNINPAGMRSQDVGQLMKLLQENKDFYFKNKEAIKNPQKDNGAAYSEFTTRNKYGLGLVGQSKQESEKGVALNKAIQDAKTKGLGIPEGYLDVISKHDLPLGTQGRVSADASTLDFYKPHDDKTFYSNVYANIKPSEVQEGFRNEIDPKTNKPTGRKINLSRTVLDPQDYAAIENRATSEYQTKTGTKTFIDKLAKDPNQYENLNSYYKKIHGKNLSLQSPEEVAKAYALSLADIGKVKESAPQYDQRDNATIAYLRSLNKIAANGSKSNPNETYDFLKKGTEVLQSGNADLANQYFSTWKASSKVGIGGNIGFQNVSYTPAGWIKIQYNAPITNNGGVTVAVPTEVKLDPKDPQILNKITGLHQQFTGSDVKVEKAAQKEAGIPTTSKKVSTKGKVR